MAPRSRSTKTKLKSYEVEAILEHKFVELFLVKWKNYKTPSWEPVEHLDNCAQLLNEFKFQQLQEELAALDSSRTNDEEASPIERALDPDSAASSQSSSARRQAQQPGTLVVDIGHVEDWGELADKYPWTCESDEHSTSKSDSEQERENESLGDERQARRSAFWRSKQTPRRRE